MGSTTTITPADREAARRAREARRRAAAAAATSDGAPPPRRRAPSPGPAPRRRRRAGLWLAGGVLALPVGWLGATAGVRELHPGKVLPGVRVDGIAVGGLTREQATRKLAHVALGQTVHLRIASADYDVTPAQAGFRYATDATVTRALAAGRTGPLRGLLGTLSGVVSDHDLTGVRTYDDRALTARAATIADATRKAGTSGGIRVASGGLQIQPVPPSAGSGASADEVASAVRQALRDGQTSVVLPVHSVQTTSPDAVARVADQANRYLDRTLTVSGQGLRTAHLQPAQIAPVLRLERKGSGVRLGVDDDKLRALVAATAAASDKPGKSAQIRVPFPGTRLTAQGSVSFSQRAIHGVHVKGGTTGHKLDQTATVAALEAAIRSGSHHVTAAAATAAPPVSVRAAQGVKDLIGTFTTPFVAGLPRVTNITRMAASLDGIVIAPGEQFDLNGIIGERTKAKGYVKAPYIAEGDKLEDSIGGGVSQVSTTMYNAAFFAGLQLDTHTPHSFYIDRYPPGRESTLNFGSIDLKWTNDTATPIVVRTSVGPDSLTVALFGDNGGREVRAETGPRVKGAGGAFAITVTRHTTYPDGTVKDEPYTTHYHAPPKGE